MKNLSLFLFMMVCCFAAQAQTADIVSNTDAKAKSCSIEECAKKMGISVEECKKLCSKSDVASNKNTASTNLSNETRVAAMSLAKVDGEVVATETAASKACTKEQLKCCKKKVVQ